MSSGVGVLTLGRGQNCYIVLIYGVFFKILYTFTETEFKITVQLDKL